MTANLNKAGETATNARRIDHNMFSFFEVNQVSHLTAFFSICAAPGWRWWRCSLIAA